MKFRGPRSLTICSLMSCGMAAATGMFFAACTGAIATNGGNGSDDDKKNPDDTPGTPDEENPDVNPPDEPDVPDVMDVEAIQMCTPSIAPAPMRRLSYSEYQTTLQDLFATLSVPQPELLRDEKAHGFENRADLLNPVALRIEQYGSAAEDIGVRVSAKPTSIVPCTPTSAAEEKTCGQKFIAEFGQKVFRRPLTTEEKTDYVAFFEKERATSSYKGAVQLTTEALLQSPQFLYRFEFGDESTRETDKIQLTPYEIATRISYLFTGGAPDKELYDAAAAGSLADAAEREKHARRLLKDARSGAMMAEFHRQWLDMDREEAKDSATYPRYDDALKNAIREESDRFVKKILWEGDGQLGTFLTTNQAVVNAPLAGLYGVAAPSSGWQDVTLNTTERAGWLTRANFLSMRAHQVHPSPPLRSVFILEKFFCQEPPAPPADADTSEPIAMAGAEPRTSRELFEQRIEPATCKGCHMQIDTIGYGLENYDAIGAFRTTDNGYPVNAAGKFNGTDVDGTFTGGVEMSKIIADSARVQSCAAENWFQFAVGRGIADEDKCRLGKLTLGLEENDGDIRELLVSLSKSPEFIFRPPVAP